MLNRVKNAVQQARFPKQAPVVFYGPYGSIWPGRAEGGHDWYCAQCGENHGGYSSDPDAERAASAHSKTHRGVRVERASR